jgi:hypothetical protein
MKSQSFDETLDNCDQINCDQSNYQLVTMVQVLQAKLKNEEITKDEIVKVLVKLGKSKRGIDLAKYTRQQYFMSKGCPVWKVLSKKGMISQSGKFIQSTISENTTKAQLEKLIDILEVRI